MKRIVLFISLIYSYAAFSQAPVRFLKYYNLPPYFYSESYDVTTTDFGYVLSGLTLDTANGYTYNKLTLIGVDGAGNQQWLKSYGNPAFQYIHDYSRKWIIKRGDNLFLVCSVVKPANIMTIVLIKFNLSGDSLWQKEFTDMQPQLGFEGFNTTPDSGFIITGFVADSAYQSMLLLKTDSLGNELWRKKINTNTIAIQGRGVVYNSIDKKYIIVGYHNPPPYDYPKSLVIVADSVGTKLSQFSFSGIHGGGLFNVIKSFDNNYIACGSNSTGVPVGSLKKVRAQIVKFDINGSVIWSKEYHEASITNQYSVLYELPDHSLIVGGAYDTLMNAGLGLDDNFLIQKTNQNGDGLWMHTIDLTNNNLIDVFSGMDIANDGGFVLTGYIYNDTTPHKYVLVKLDSMGCDSIGCQFVGLTELPQSNINFTIYPNPNDGNMVLDYTLTANEKGIIIVYDITGKLIIHYEIDSANNQLIINDWKLNKGIYIYHILVNNKIVKSDRLVIIK